MGSSSRIENGELLSNVGQYLAFKPAIEGFFNNVGLHELVDRCAKAIRVSLLITDLGFSIITQSRDMEVSNEFRNEEFPEYLSPGLIAEIRKSKYIEKRTSQHHSSVVIPYKNHSVMIALISISVTKDLLLVAVADDRVFSQEDSWNIEKASQFLTLEFQKDSSKIYHQPVKMNRSIEKLIGGVSLTEEELISNNKGCEWPHYRTWHLVMINDPAAKNITSLAVSINTLLRKYVPAQNITVYGKSFLAIMPPEAVDHLKSEEDQVSDMLKLNQLYCAIGRPVEDFSELKREYEVCERMIKASAKFGIHLAVYHRMRMVVIADLISQFYPVEDFCHPAVYKLMQYDEENNSRLVETLRYYLKYKEDIPKVTEKLFIGKSTLFYRLGKIREIGGVSLRDAEELNDLYFSLKLLSILDHLPPVG